MIHKFVIELIDDYKGYEQNVEYLERIYGAYPIKEHDERIYNKAIDDVIKALIPRLTDAIYPKDVEGMRNLINDVAKQLKEGGKNEQSI